jgi:hypothetical protein
MGLDVAASPVASKVLIQAAFSHSAFVRARLAGGRAGPLSVDELFPGEDWACTDR